MNADKKTLADMVETNLMMVFYDIKTWEVDILKNKKLYKRIEFQALYVNDDPDTQTGKETYKLEGYRNFTPKMYEVFCMTDNNVHIGTAKDMDDAQALARKYTADNHVSRLIL